MKGLLSIILVFTLCITAMAGCTNSSENTHTPTESGVNIQHVMLGIDEAENAVSVTVENCAELEGREDMIRGTTVLGNINGSFAEVFSCSDFGTAFFGSYDVTAEHLENATFCFGVSKQEYAPITCGVNYYDLMMDGTATDCKSIRITYSKSVELLDVTGDFSIFLFPLSDDCPMQVGQSMITVSGSIADTGNVALNWNGEKFILEADAEITNCKVVTEVSDCTEQFTDEADAAGQVFQITVTEGKPVIAGDNA